MCASCDAWTAARHDPSWRAPRGKIVGTIKRVKAVTLQLPKPKARDGE